MKGLIEVVDFKILEVRIAKTCPHAFCFMSHIVIKVCLLSKLLILVSISQAFVICGLSSVCLAPQFLVFLPGESHGQRNLGGCTVHEVARVGHNLTTKTSLPKIYHNLK